MQMNRYANFTLASVGGKSDAIIRALAKVAELVDALDLGSSASRRESSSLSFRTKVEFQAPDTRGFFSSIV